MEDMSKDLFPERSEVPAAYWRIALAGLLDAAFAIFCVVLLFRFYTIAPIAFLLESINSTLLVLILLVVYRFLTITFFSATFGMFLLKIKFLNGDDEPLSFTESVLAALFILYNGTSYYNR
jgi:hypothetical protein